MTPLLTVDAITKRFTASQPAVVNAVSFEVYPSEMFALLGPSGCGKTTTLRLIAGFEKTDAGTITMAERVLVNSNVHVPPESRGIGFVFQDYALFPHKNVLENVAFGLRKMPKKTRKVRAMEGLEMVDLANLHNRLPHHLSGGEQQRVALARSIVARPKLLLLDEPFSGLDPGLRQATRDEVRALLKAEHISAVLVTHDQEEALSFAERLAVMKEGTLEQIGTPEEMYHQPRTAYVAGFLGRTNFIRAHAKDWIAETSFGCVNLENPTTGEVLLSIRPEHFTLTSPDSANQNTKCARIIGRMFKGNYLIYHVLLDRQHYFVQTDPCCTFRVGDNVLLKAKSAVPVAPDTETNALYDSASVDF